MLLCVDGACDWPITHLNMDESEGKVHEVPLTGTLINFVKFYFSNGAKKKRCSLFNS